MIYETLEAVRLQLEKELSLSTKNWSSSNKVCLANLYNADGSCSLQKNCIAISLINIEETFDEQYNSLQRASLNGYTEQLRPPLTLTLSVLFTANFEHYDQALKMLAFVMEYFQRVPMLNRQLAPDMSDNIDKLHFKLFSQNLEQAKDIWSFLGGRYLPSVLYNIRGTEVAADQTISITTPQSELPMPSGRRV